MAVTLTRAAAKLLFPRTIGKNTDDEVDSYVSRASDQVAAWVTEAATGSGFATFSQFYEDELARLQIQMYALSDRMSAQAEVEENYSEVSPQGSSQATERKFYVKNLDRNWEKLKAARDEILRKLGVSIVTEALPALAKSTIRAKEYTVGAYSTANPGTDWTDRSDDPRWNDR